MNTKNLTLLPPEALFEAVSQLLDEGYDAEFTVTGNSMLPLLCHGRDSVVLRRPDSPLRRGDIILCKAKQGFLLHRVMKTKKDAVRTAGDHNCYLDEYVSSQDVLGRVIGFTRKGKYVSCKSLPYRLSSFVWRIFFPFRPLLLRLLTFVKRRTG